MWYDTAHVIAFDKIDDSIAMGISTDGTEFNCICLGLLEISAAGT